MKKELREKVWNKFKGHCAYCGKKIAYEDMQVDHIVPCHHDLTAAQKRFIRERQKEKKFVYPNIGSDDFDNLNPSCRRCNYHKSNLSLEDFRKVIQDKINVLNDSWHFKIAVDFGLIEIKENVEVKFYFERL